MTAAIVGVDVGGTTTAAGVVTSDGDVLADESAPTRGTAPGGLLGTIVALIGRVRDEVGRRPGSMARGAGAAAADAWRSTRAGGGSWIRRALGSRATRRRPCWRPLGVTR